MADFQNKLGDGFSKIQSEIDQGKQKLANSKEINRFKKEVQDASIKKSKILISMGLTAHQLVREGKIKDEGLKQLAKSMVEYDKVIYDANRKIDELKVESIVGLKCECGTPIDSNSKFCGSCGKDVSKILAADTRSKCDCGAVINGNVKFCANCGKEVVIKEQQSQEDKNIKCSSCEKQIPENSTYCNICGTKIS